MTTSTMVIFKIVIILLTFADSFTPPHNITANIISNSGEVKEI
jgi:hypothetical protein